MNQFMIDSIMEKLAELSSEKASRYVKATFWLFAWSVFVQTAALVWEVFK
jgi:hypothetical protein